jgi:N-acyl-D-amino-acid deacylase
MRTALLLLFPFLLGAQQYDLLITNGKIFDGAGNPWFAGDIAVRGDTIAAMGRLPDARSALQIDAQGLAVTPGFIDIHSHGQRGIFAVPTAENYLREGVTTIIEGPDGSSAVPLGQFLNKVSQTPISINFASFVGMDLFARP